MNSKVLLISGCFIAAVVFLGNAGIFTDYPDNLDGSPVALVKKIVKDVTYRTAVDKSDWEIAKTGQPLYDGGEVKTGIKSLALVLFTDGSGLLRVRENSILHIYGQTENKKLNKDAFLEKGLIGFDVTKQQQEEEFKLTTPTVVASIRGTAGFMSFDNQDSTTTIFLEHGEVDFKHTISGNSGKVTSGKSALIYSNGNISYDSISTTNKKIYKFTRTTSSKKIIIETKYGSFEINYYSE